MQIPQPSVANAPSSEQGSGGEETQQKPPATEPEVVDNKRDKTQEEDQKPQSDTGNGTEFATVKQNEPSVVSNSEEPAIPRPTVVPAADQNKDASHNNSVAQAQNVEKPTTPQKETDASMPQPTVTPREPVLKSDNDANQATSVSESTTDMPAAKTQPEVQSEPVLKPESTPDVQQSVPRPDTGIPIEHDEIKADQTVDLHSSVATNGDVHLQSSETPGKTPEAQSSNAYNQDLPGSTPQKNPVQQPDPQSAPQPLEPTPAPAEISPQPEAVSPKPQGSAEPHIENQPPQSDTTVSPQPEQFPEQPQNPEPVTSDSLQQDAPFIPDDDYGINHKSNKIVTIAIFVVGFLIIGIGGYFGYSFLTSDSGAETTDTEDVQDNDNSDNQTEIQDVTNLSESDVTESSITVTWERPEAPVSEFKLSISVDDEIIDDISVSGSKSDYAFKDLKDDTEYQIIVKSVSAGGLESEGVSIKVSTKKSENSDDNSNISNDEVRQQDIVDLILALNDYYEIEGGYPKAKNYASMLNSLIAKQAISRFIQDPNYPENEYRYTVSSNQESFTLRIYFDRPELLTLPVGDFEENYYIVTINAAEYEALELFLSIDAEEDDVNKSEDEDSEDEDTDVEEKDDLEDENKDDDTDDFDDVQEIRTATIITDPADGEAKKGETIVFTVDVSGISGDPEDIEWVLEEQKGIIGKGESIRYQYDDAGNYTVKVDVTLSDDTVLHGETLIIITN